MLLSTSKIVKHNRPFYYELYVNSNGGEVIVTLQKMYSRKLIKFTVSKAYATYQNRITSVFAVDIKNYKVCNHFVAVRNLPPFIWNTLMDNSKTLNV